MIWKKIGIAKYLMEYKLSTSSTDFHFYFSRKRENIFWPWKRKSCFIGNLCWTKKYHIYINVYKCIYCFQDWPFFLPSLLDFFLETDKWRNGFYILLNFTNVDWHATMDKWMYYGRENLIEFFFVRFKQITRKYNNKRCRRICFWWNSSSIINYCYSSFGNMFCEDSVYSYCIWFDSWD